MAPRNQDEAKEIRDIITTFKRASLPGLGASPALGGFIDGDTQADQNEEQELY